MRCAVIDELGNVVNVIKADSSKDTLHGFSLVNLDEFQPCSIGYIYVNGKFEMGEDLLSMYAGQIRGIEDEAFDFSE